MRLFPIPALTDNYIWLFADDSHALVVDPGESAPVEAALEQLNLTLTAILLTHHHADHIAGAAYLSQKFKASIFAPDDERISTATERVHDGDPLTFDKPQIQLEVIGVPGHTLSHIAFYGNSTLFCGDTLFSVGCGRLFEGTPSQMLASLDRLCHLPGETRVCCGHEYTLTNCAFALTIEPENAALHARIAKARYARQSNQATLPSTLAIEWDTNPFLRIDVPAVCKSLADELGASIHDRIARFALLRQRKDQFRETVT